MVITDTGPQVSIYLSEKRSVQITEKGGLFNEDEEVPQH